MSELNTNDLIQTVENQIEVEALTLDPPDLASW